MFVNINGQSTTDETDLENSEIGNLIDIVTELRAELASKQAQSVDSDDVKHLEQN